MGRQADETIYGRRPGTAKLHGKDKLAVARHSDDPGRPVPSPREGSHSRARAWLVVRANRHVTQLTQRGDARDPLRDNA